MNKWRQNIICWFIVVPYRTLKLIKVIRELHTIYLQVCLIIPFSVSIFYSISVWGNLNDSTAREMNSTCEKNGEGSLSDWIHIFFFFFFGHGKLALRAATVIIWGTYSWKSCWPLVVRLTGQYFFRLTRPAAQKGTDRFSQTISLLFLVLCRCVYVL